jgi:hypothetical protein
VRARFPLLMHVCLPSLLDDAMGAGAVDKERVLFWKEMSAGLYRSVPYYIAKVLTELPYTVTLPLVRRVVRFDWAELDSATDDEFDRREASGFRCIGILAGGATADAGCVLYIRAGPGADGVHSRRIFALGRDPLSEHTVANGARMCDCWFRQIHAPFGRGLSVCVCACV